MPHYPFLTVIFISSIWLNFCVHSYLQIFIRYYPMQFAFIFTHKDSLSVCLWLSHFFFSFWTSLPDSKTFLNVRYRQPLLPKAYDSKVLTVNLNSIVIMLFFVFRWMWREVFIENVWRFIYCVFHLFAIVVVITITSLIACTCNGICRWDVCEYGVSSWGRYNVNLNRMYSLTVFTLRRN